MMRITVPIVGLLLLIGCTLPAGSARAAATLEVSPSKLIADQPLAPGNAFGLPSFTVTNGSDAPMRVTVSLSDHQEGDRALAPADWFEVEPAELTVEPGQSRDIRVRLVVPPGADAGAYRRWLRFEGAPDGGGLIVNAPALEVPFLFDVAPGGATSNEVDGGSSTPALSWAALIALLIIVGVRARRWSGREDRTRADPRG